MFASEPVFKRANGREKDFSRFRVLEIVMGHEGLEALEGSAGLIVGHFERLIIGLRLNMIPI